MDEDFPRVYFTRERHRSNRTYFGPYSNAKRTRATLDVLSKVFLIRSCQGTEPGRRSGSPCLDYHINRCGAPCVGYVTREQYMEAIDGVVAFLSGRYKEIERDIERRMNDAADGAGVRAGGARAKPAARRALAARAPARRQRLGRLARHDRRRGRRHRRQRAGLPGPRRRARRPPVVLPREPRRAASWGRSRSSSSPSTTRAAPGSRRRSSSSRRSTRTSARRSPPRSPSGAAPASRCAPPSAATSARILELAERNALLALDQERLKAERTRQQRVEALDELQRELSLDVLPLRIECFDISNLMGTHTVASMVVFEGGAPKKSDYRRFTIRSLEEGVPDDFAAMREVLARRLASWESQQELSPHDPGFNESFAALPNVIVIDGGKGQLAAGLEVLQDFRERGVAVVSLAKRIEEVFVPGREDADRARRTTRRRCSCSSACATRRTASRSRTTARAATGR